MRIAPTNRSMRKASTAVDERKDAAGTAPPLLAESSRHARENAVQTLPSTATNRC